jgi:hypothetical protein
MIQPPHSRRALLGMMAMCATQADPAEPKDWGIHFRAFLKQLNRFIEAQNDGIFDVKQWKRVEESWAELKQQ